MDPPADAVPLPYPQYRREAPEFPLESDCGFSPLLVERIFSHDAEIWGLEINWNTQQLLDFICDTTPQIIGLRPALPKIIPGCRAPMLWYRRDMYGFDQRLPYDEWLLSNFNAALVQNEVSNPGDSATSPKLETMRNHRGWAYNEAIEQEDKDDREEEHGRLWLDSDRAKQTKSQWWDEGFHQRRSRRGRSYRRRVATRRSDGR
jgi:hypothetical protein